MHRATIAAIAVT